MATRFYFLSQITGRALYISSKIWKLIRFFQLSDTSGVPNWTLNIPYIFMWLLHMHFTPQAPQWQDTPPPLTPSSHLLLCQSVWRDHYHHSTLASQHLPRGISATFHVCTLLAGFPRPLHPSPALCSHFSRPATNQSPALCSLFAGFADIFHLDTRRGILTQTLTFPRPRFPFLPQLETDLGTINSRNT